MLVAFAVVYGTQVKLDVAIKLKDHCVTSGSSPAPQIGIGPSTLWGRHSHEKHKAQHNKVYKITRKKAYTQRLVSDFVSTPFALKLQLG